MKPQITTEINAIKLANLNYEGACNRVLEWAMNDEQRYVCICNVHSVTSSKWDAPLKQALQQSDLNTTDGMPLVWLQRRLGSAPASRVYGPTLMITLLERAVAQKARIALYGGHPERMPKLLEFLNKRFPSIDIVATIIPPFRPLTQEEDKAYTLELVEARPQITFVGIGCPKQENWMNSHKKKVPGVLLGVGAAFDFHAGAVNQAPSWMQKIAMEWAFRLAMEPKRLMRRYLSTNPVFLYTAAKQILKYKILGTQYQTVKTIEKVKTHSVRKTKHWAICIATYQRPEQLKRLLKSIDNCRRPAELTIELRIVDNDEAASAQKTVEDFAQKAHGFTAINYSIEPRQNIAHARNTAIEMSAADAYLFVDDDEFVSEDWLVAFNKNDATYSAAAHFGPVFGVLPNTAKTWMTRGAFFDKPVGISGAALDWKNTRTSNTFVQSEWFIQKGFRFDPELGRSGGSDSDLFARMASAGANYVACSEASAFENVPTSRASFSWLWSRAFRNGLIYQRTVREMDGEGNSLTRAMKRLARGILLNIKGIPALSVGKPEICIRGLLKLPLLLGGLKASLRPSSTTKHIAYKTEKKRVALLTNIVSPYRKPVFESLAKTPNWDLRIFVDAQTEFDRNWSVELDGIETTATPCCSWTRKTVTSGEIPYEQKLTQHLPYGLPFQLFKFRPEVIISLELGFRTALAALYAKCTGTQLIIWSYQSRISSQQSWSRKIWRSLLLKQASSVVGMGIQAREVLIAWGVPITKIIDAPNAADHQTLIQRLNQKATEANIRAIREQYSKNKKLAIVVGRLIPLKGIEQIVETWKRLPLNIRNEWKLTFIGSGPLASFIHGEDTNQIELAGATSPDKIADWYAAADLHIFPSCGDVWGLVVNEASTCNTPTLCSIYAGCCDDLIEDGKNGFQLNLSNSAEADAQLNAVLTRQDLPEIGRAAKATIADYTIENMAKGFRNALQTTALS
jgi:N-acetylglucosaminyldiphosphoundecaprenol N-acetyl-beta-D-mannosaminyltransferase